MCMRTKSCAVLACLQSAVREFLIGLIMSVMIHVATYRGSCDE